MNNFTFHWSILWVMPSFVYELSSVSHESCITCYDFTITSSVTDRCELLSCVYTKELRDDKVFNGSLISLDPIYVGRVMLSFLNCLRLFRKFTYFTSIHKKNH